jgi:hypothetical protein
MTFRFINLFWPMLALAAVPLLVHLFARTRPPALQFSSVIFLRRVARNTMKARKPRDLLVLLLRTLAALAMVFMVFRPIFFADARWLAPGARRHVVIVVDRSASMGYNEGGRTRFAAACAEGADIIEGLSAADTANIVWLDAAPAPVFPDMGVNFGFLRETLRKARVSSQPGAASEAIRLAVRMLEAAEGRKELHLISDFQRTTWEASKSTLPPDVAFYAIPIAQTDAANVAITDLRTQPLTGLPNERMNASVEVANFSDAPQQVSLFFAFGEARDKRDVVIPAWEKTTLLFQQTAARQGDTILSASLDCRNDGFADDNRRQHIFPVVEHLTVGLPETVTPDRLRFEQAVRALPWTRLIPLSESATASMELPDVAFLPGVPATDKRLRMLLREGVMVIWAPPPGTPVSELGDLYSGQAGTATLEQGHAFRLQATGIDDPALLLFEDGRYGDPAGGTIRQRLRLPTVASEHAKVLLSYTDGIPAVLRTSTPSHLILWNLPLAAEHSDFADQVTFVPFIGELLLSHRLHAKRALAGRIFTSGDQIQRRFPGARLLDIRLVDSKQKACELQLGRGPDGGGYCATASQPEPGAYTWRSGDKTLGHSVVNFSARESDLRMMTETEIESMGARQVADAQTLRALHSGTEIWQILLLLGAAALFAEGLILFLFERRP